MATLNMERTFGAAPEKVFEVITQTDMLLQWWGPEGTKITQHNLDLSKPGPWFAIMVGPQGHPAKVGGQVLHIVPNQSVEFTLSFLDERDEPMDTSTITFETSPNGSGGTHFQLTQTGLNAEYIPDMMNKGWNSALRRLEDLLIRP
ncbi:MAG: SRPBCC family protein [Marinosulfonomonas sp.]